MKEAEDILVSIVMPAYNAEKTVGFSIESVLKQTYKNWELIVINDCSKDKTEDLIKKYAEKDSRIIVLSNEKNSGVSLTRNRGIQTAKGEWIAFLDSDDLWKIDKLEKQIELLHQKKQADLIFTGSAFINSYGEKSGYSLEVPQSVTFRQLLKQNVISCSSVLVKKELVTKYKMQHDEMHEDYAVWLQILKEGRFAYGINEPLLIYRLSEQSKSSDKKKAAGMTFQVYRFVGLNYLQAVYYFGWYAVKNLKKYYLIKKNIRKDGDRR